MSEQRVTLKASDGRTAEAVAELIRYGPAARRWRAAMFIAGGVLLGLTCSIVPGPHVLVTLWLPPAAGVWLGLRALKSTGKVVRLTGRCPACDQPLEMHGGGIDDARECRRCKAALELTPASGPSPQ